MSKLHQTISYLDYWLNAVDRHSLQAPYIYNLYNNVIRNKTDHDDFQRIERMRDQLKKNESTVRVADYGAGSQVTGSADRSIREIASRGITRKKYSQYLYRLCEHLKAKNVVELGTSLGITTLYLSLNKEVKVTTFEGAPSLCKIAKKIFTDLDKTNIDLVAGNIDRLLPAFLKDSAPIDVAFIDANHRYTPTIRYFDLLLPKAHAGSCFIFDDIHWSKEMEKAWKVIKCHNNVSLSIDIYQMGLVFFNPDLRKQNYVLEV